MRRKLRKEQGITLISLIITIVVMLILVAVSVNVIIKSNLIGIAEKTVGKYNKVAEEEGNGGTIEIEGKQYASIDEYLKEKGMKDEETQKPTFTLTLSPDIGFLSGIRWRVTPISSDITNVIIEKSIDGAEFTTEYTGTNLTGQIADNGSMYRVKATIRDKAGNEGTLAKTYWTSSENFDQNNLYINDEKLDPDEYNAIFSNNYKDGEIPNDVLDIISKVNDNTDQAATLIRDVDLSTYQLLAPIQNLSIGNVSTGEVLNNPQDVQITWIVPELAKTMEGIKMLHYSTNRNMWEIIDVNAEDIDIENHTIKQHFDDLSPVAIIYEK